MSTMRQKRYSNPIRFTRSHMINVVSVVCCILAGYFITMLNEKNQPGITSYSSDSRIFTVDKYNIDIDEKTVKTLKKSKDFEQMKEAFKNDPTAKQIMKDNPEFYQKVKKQFSDQ